MAQAESTRIDYYSEMENRRNRSGSGTKLTTVQMVQVALEELHASNNKGVTLQGIKKFMSEKYDVLMNTKRKNIISNFLHGLLEAGDMINVTGKGLVGHLRLRTPSYRVKQQNSRNSRKVPAREANINKKRTNSKTHITTSSSKEREYRSDSEAAGTSKQPPVKKMDAPKAPKRPRKRRIVDETPRSSQLEHRDSHIDLSEILETESNEPVSSRLRSSDSSIDEVAPKPSKRRLFACSTVKSNF